MLWTTDSRAFSRITPANTRKYKLKHARINTAHQQNNTMSPHPPLGTLGRLVQQIVVLHLKSEPIGWIKVTYRNKKCSPDFPNTLTSSVPALTCASLLLSSLLSSIASLSSSH